MDKDVTFLIAAAGYFEKRPTNGEDRAHWANVYNAANCRRIARRIEVLSNAGQADYSESPFRAETSA